MSCQIQIPRLVVAAQKGGAGKTLFTLGLLSALTKRGFKVAPFKKGPDYIDAGWLGRASRRPCRNLDPFLMDESSLLSLFVRGSEGADLAVIEGNRGLYDGVDLEGSCSTAQLARTLKAPIVLVLDCTKVTRSLAALLKGFLEFEEVEIKGVVLNRVARSRHENIVARSIEHYTGVPVLGAIPRLKLLFPERHLGLIPWQEFRLGESLLEKLESSVSQNVDLDRIVTLAESAPRLEISPKPPEGVSLWPLTEHGHLTTRINRSKPYPAVQELFMDSGELKGMRIGVLRDRAFQFYYPENLEALEALGAELLFLDAFEEKRLPEIQALYIGGGFPETQAEALAENRSFMKDLKEAVEEGLPVYAECGGLMYLGERIVWKGKAYPMSGIFPIEFEVKDRPQGHGYTVVRVVQENPFYPRGIQIQGHEFHYSLPIVKDDSKLIFCFEVERGFGFDGRRDGVLYKKTFGTYTHVHVASTPLWLAGMIHAIGLKERLKRGALGQNLSLFGEAFKSI